VENGNLVSQIPLEFGREGYSGVRHDILIGTQRARSGRGISSGGAPIHNSTKIYEKKEFTKIPLMIHDICRMKGGIDRLITISRYRVITTCMEGMATG